LSSSKDTKKSEVVGTWTGNNVNVTNGPQANAIYNKGYFGTPQSGGGIVLEPTEAVYLSESRDLSVELDGRIMDFPSMFQHALALESGFDIRYIVYRDLRKRGFIVRGSSPMDFKVYARGEKPPRGKVAYMIRAVSESSPFILRDVSGQMDNMREGIGFLMAIVDEEGDLTYYGISGISPDGENPRDMEKKDINCVLLEDRGMVWDPSDAERLRESGFYGKPMGDALQLSLVEVCYLARRGVIVLSDGRGTPIDREHVFDRCASIQEGFERNYAGYSHLRELGLWVKTGFKYGTHFRVYQKNPQKSHAQYLINVVDIDLRSTWAELSRGVRLSHGVRKNLVFMVMDPGCRVSEMLRFERVRP